jgi:hypothetical protein
MSLDREDAKKQPFSRKLLQLEEDSSRHMDAANIFQSFQGWLPDEGIESLEVSVLLSL